MKLYQLGSSGAEGRCQDASCSRDGIDRGATSPFHSALSVSEVTYDRLTATT